MLHYEADSCMEEELVGEGHRETSDKAGEMDQRRDEGGAEGEGRWEADGRKGLGNRLDL